MKVKMIIEKEITAVEGKRVLTMTFNKNNMEEFDTTLPYIKSLEDWDFYSRAIARILKELKK